MIPNDPQQMIAMLQAQIQPWHEAVASPAKAQEAVLQRYLPIYAATEYGKQHGADKVGSLADFRRAFPVMTYEEYRPLIDKVMAGDVGLLLTEPPIGWAITRGTTGGDSARGGPCSITSSRRSGSTCSRASTSTSTSHRW